MLNTYIKDPVGPPVPYCTGSLSCSSGHHGQFSVFRGHQQASQRPGILGIRSHPLIPLRSECAPSSPGSKSAWVGGSRVSAHSGSSEKKDTGCWRGPGDVTRKVRMGKAVIFKNEREFDPFY